MGHMHRRHWGWHDENDKNDKNDKDFPPFFAEWHRRAHTVSDWDKAPEEKQK